MEIKKLAFAGTLESSDAYVVVKPGTEGIRIDLNSVVSQQFGDAIREVIRDVLRELDVENADIDVIDKGALDCVLRARVETAVLRGKEEA